MTTPALDQRSPGRRARDEQVAAEPQMAPLELPTDAATLPAEVHLGGRGEPAEIAPSVSRRQKERGLGEVVLERNRAEHFVGEPRIERADGGRVAADDAVGEGVHLIEGEFHAGFFSFSVAWS